MKINRFFILILLVISGNLVSQNKTLDSLQNIITQSKYDTNQVKALTKVGILKYFNVGNYDTALIYYNQALVLAQKLNYKQYIANCYNNIGLLNYAQSNYPKALDFNLKSLKIREEIGDKQGIANCYNSIGLVYMGQSNYPKALYYYLKSLKIAEEMGNKQYISTCYMNMGIIYQKQNNYPKALYYYLKSLKIAEEMGNKRGVTNCYANVGNIYYYQNNYPKALYYYLKSLKTAEEMGNKRTIGYCYTNIGNTYYYQNNYPKALNYNLKSLKIYKEMGDELGIATCYVILSGLFTKLNLPVKGKIYADSAIKLSKQIGNLENERLGYQYLALADSSIGNYKGAYLNYVQFKILSDSIFNTENSKQIGDLKLNFELEKKEAELIAKAEVQKLVTAAEAQKQKLFLLLVSCILLLVAVFAIFMYRRFKITQKQKNIIELKEKETQLQKHIIEEKHKEITDSINYAERIQRSFMATKELLDNNLKDYFIFFQPKDVVSGDFYWASKLEDGRFALVTADSTGHGVPGAIMSILNISSLEKAVEQGGKKPSEILNFTRKSIIERLKKDGSPEGGKDGMDASLICFDFDRNVFAYSAANNPIWVVRGTEIIELDPEKMPVGKHDKDTIPFTQKDFLMMPNDMVYTLTDGMPDQFGGPKGKKFMYKRLKELLISIAGLPVEKQRNLLSESFNNWKGDIEQIDDVTLVGIRI